jgi:nucleoside-diphosphate-sugar epimerase
MILVTGATGYIGQKLLSQLSNSEPILVLSRKPQAVKKSNVTFVHGDLSQADSLVGKFDHVDTVIHLASITHAYDQETYDRINVQGTQNLLNALPKNLKQFVYVSTNCAEPGAGWYGESKLAAEKLVKKYLKNYVILRVADVYGGQGEKSLEKLIDSCRQWPVFPMIGSGDFKMAPVHIDDVLFAIQKSLAIKGQHELDVSGLEPTTLNNLVTSIYSLFKKPATIIPVPLFMWQLAAKVSQWLHLSFMYPDQIDRLIVEKKYSADQTWKFFKHQPAFFTEWLRRQVTAK